MKASSEPEGRRTVKASSISDGHVAGFLDVPGGRLYNESEGAGTSRLGEVRVPTLVVWGDLDEAGVVAGSRVMAAGIPGARVHVFPGAAHTVNLEQPDAFTRLVLEFLAEVDGRSA